MTEPEKKKFLVDNGWVIWYSPNYWVHPKTVMDSTKQNYLNYGMDLESAYIFETEKLLPFGNMLSDRFLYDWSMS